MIGLSGKYRAKIWSVIFPFTNTRGSATLIGSSSLSLLVMPFYLNPECEAEF